MNKIIGISCFVIMCLAMLFITACGSDNGSPSATSTKEGEAAKQAENNQQATEVQGNIKDALTQWTQSLPTEYRLEDLSSFCSQTVTANCAKSDDFQPSDITEGYSRTFFTTTGETGIATILLFKTTDEVQVQYNKLVNKVKDARGYKEITVSANCFGYEQDLTIMTVQKIICSKLNAVYTVGMQGSALYGTTDLKKYAKQLGEQIE